MHDGPPHAGLTHTHTHPPGSDELYPSHDPPGGAQSGGLASSDAASHVTADDDPAGDDRQYCGCASAPEAAAGAAMGDTQAHPPPGRRCRNGADAGHAGGCAAASVATCAASCASVAAGGGGLGGGGLGGSGLTLVVHTRPHCPDVSVSGVYTQYAPPSQEVTIQCVYQSHGYMVPSLKHMVIVDDAPTAGGTPLSEPATLAPQE